MENMNEKINGFVASCQKMIDEHHVSEGYHDFMKVTLTISFGKKYAKIIQNDTGKSVWGFINMTNGDLLKAASWKAPAKHARGNIFDPDCIKGVSVYRPAYLR